MGDGVYKFCREKDCEGFLIPRSYKRYMYRKLGEVLMCNECGKVERRVV